MDRSTWTAGQVMLTGKFIFLACRFDVLIEVEDVS
jgi:hypothetical protein